MSEMRKQASYGAAVALSHITSVRDARFPWEAQNM
jgi:hypothetical protein